MRILGQHVLLLLSKIKVLIYQYIKVEFNFLLFTEHVEFPFYILRFVEIIFQIRERRDTSSVNSLCSLQT